MFWVRFWSFVMGYVTMVIEGKAVEKLVNMAVSRGIYLWDIKWLGPDKVVLKARVSSFKALRHIVRKTGGRLRISKKRGIPFAVAKVRRRQMMLVGALACVTILYVLSSFIWFIDVKGNKKVPADVILSSAEEAGLYSGTAKWKLNNSAVERKIKNDLPNLSWVGVTVTGTKATIKVAEKVVPEIEDNNPADIVAAKTGLVEEVLVLSGVSIAKEGDMVQKGDLLISGVIRSEIKKPAEERIEDLEEKTEESEKPEEVIRYVRARGIVKARVWYEGYGEAYLIEKNQVKTGKTSRSIILKLGDKSINLQGDAKAPFKQYVTEKAVKTLPQWRNIKFPVELITTHFYEMKTVENQYNYSQAKEMALSKANKQIEKKLPQEYQVLDKKVHIIDTNEPNIVRIKVIIEIKEDLGQVRPIRDYKT